ncbi:polysaccharide deacetylase family protein [Paenibacillus sp. strain BS8-2]
MNWRGRSLCIFCVVIGLVLCGFASQPHNRNYYERRGEAIWEVTTDEQLMAFTFDDGPNANMTPLILDLLKEYDAKATFFVVGNRIDKNVGIIKREAEEGHEVANHTYNHVFLNSSQSAEKIDQEIKQTKQKIEEITGQDSPWFRPPGGFINDRVIDAARKYGYTVTLWSWHQDTKDWRAPGVDYIVKKVLDNARNGDIVLMHDHVQGSTQTYQALKLILPELKARGFRLVTVSELVKSKRSNEAHHWDVGE